MASEIIRQGAAPIRGRAQPARSKALDRLRAFGARGIRMAQTAGREFREDLAGGGGDSAEVTPTRVRAPTWLAIALILGAVDLGRLEERLHTISERQSEQKASQSAALSAATDAQQKAFVAVLAEQRRSIDVDLARLARQLDDEKERNQALREFLIRKRIL